MSYDTWKLSTPEQDSPCLDGCCGPQDEKPSEYEVELDCEACLGRGYVYRDQLETGCRVSCEECGGGKRVLDCWPVDEYDDLSHAHRDRFPVVVGIAS